MGRPLNLSDCDLPNQVDEELVNKLYVEAWRSGCKGCTIYRDGSRSGVMISVSKKDKKKDEKPVDEEKAKDLNSAEEHHEHICNHPNVIEVRPKRIGV